MRMMGRIAASLKRTAIHAGPTVLGIIVLDFLLLQLMPGDAADVIASESGVATAETMAALRERFGLDQPVVSQLLNFLGHLAHFDLGFSPRYNMPVLDMIMTRLPNTLLLMVTALSFALVLGILLGSVMAAWAGRWPDRVLSVVVLLFYSMPGFWVGLMAVVLFSVKLGWLPTGGMMTIGAGLSGVGRVLDVAHHLILPAASLSLFYAAIYTRLMRASMLEVAGQDYVRTARAKGISERRVMYGHTLRNALLPLVTVVGVQVGSLLGGSVLVESVFGWPGLGRLAFEAVQQRDYNLLLGILLLSSLLVIAVNLVIDLLYAVLDPRIELR